MDTGETAVRTLVVVANAEFARFLLRRGGNPPLEELVSCSMTTGDLASASASSSDARLMPAPPEDMYDVECRRREFLVRLASRIERETLEARAGRLVLCAPPPVLCGIRNNLPLSSRRLLACELAIDIAAASLDEIYFRLREYCSSLDA